MGTFAVGNRIVMHYLVGGIVGDGCCYFDCFDFDSIGSVDSFGVFVVVIVDHHPAAVVVGLCVVGYLIATMPFVVAVVIVVGVIVVG